MSRRKGSKNTHWLVTTTVALSDSEFLKRKHISSFVETYCQGYEFINGVKKRKKELDGHYFTKELRLKSIIK
jgi:hypothetical protein